MADDHSIATIVVSSGIETRKLQSPTGAPRLRAWTPAGAEIEEGDPIVGTPSRAQLEQWATNYVALWNAGDRDAWAENWRSVAPGDFRMFDPVGSPEKRGFEECALKPFDLFQPRVRFKVVDGTFFICGNEVAWLLENHITADSRSFVGLSIETYRFEPDGSVLIRTYYRVPERTEDELGAIFETYLPEKS